MSELLGGLLKKLLVYCYFCPDSLRRPGGVQQIVGALLSGLKESFGWDISVIHTGTCEASPSHFSAPEQGEEGQPDAVNPMIVIESASQLRSLADSHDVVLSIDRLLPCSLPRPSILMSNTLNYVTEVTAVQGSQWVSIVVPTNHFARSVRALNQESRVHVVPYGLPNEMLQAARVVPPDSRDQYPTIVRLPHRPDRRKGHREAIEGLARALPEALHVRLEISWLDEERYVLYRAELEQLANDLGIDQQVSFRQWLDRNDRWSATIESCALLQLGAFEESFGLSIVESVLFRRPAITCHQPAVREVVGPTDLLIEIANPFEWYSALKDYWAITSGIGSPSQVRQPLSEDLSLERMCARYDQVLADKIQKQ